MTCIHCDHTLVVQLPETPLNRPPLSPEPPQPGAPRPSPHLSYGDDDVALGAVLAGEAEVALRQADLPQGVEVAEGHPQEALVDLQKVLLPGKTEEHPELLAPGVGLQTSGGERRDRGQPQTK